MSKVIDGTPAGTSPATGSYADLFRQSEAPAKETTTPESPRHGSEEAETPASATPEGKVETAPASDAGDELEQEPEHSGSTEEKRRASRGWARLKTRAIKAETRSEFLERQLAEIKTAAPAAAAKPETAKSQPATARPKLAEYTGKIGTDYESWEEASDAHAEALADWKYDQREQARESRESEKRKTEEQSQARAQFEKRRKDAAKKYEDFEETAFSDDLQLNSATARYVQRNADGLDVLYFLGKNPAEAERIVQLEDADDVIFELKAISRKLSKPPAVKTETSAPNPPRKVGGKTPAQGDPVKSAAERGDWEEYNRLMQDKDLADWRKRNGR